MMLPYLISLLIIPMAAVNLAQWGTKIKAFLHPRDWHKVQMKPIDCAYCIAFWLNIIIQPVDGLQNIIIFALASSIVAKKIEDYL